MFFLFFKSFWLLSWLAEKMYVFLSPSSRISLKIIIVDVFFIHLLFSLLVKILFIFYKELLLMHFKAVIKMRNVLLYQSYKNGFYYYCYISSLLLIIYSEDNQIQISSHDNGGLCERKGERKGNREGKTWGESKEE